jgi:hypothetical protein
MKPYVQVIGFVLLNLVGCSLVSLFDRWCSAELEFALGANAGIFLPSPLPEAFFGGILLCFLFALASAWLMGMQRTLKVFVGICVAGVFCGFLADILSASFGTQPREYFLDGFRLRVMASGIQPKVTEWARQVLADPSLRSDDFEFNLSRDKIPPFFSTIVNNTKDMDAVVSFESDNAVPESMNVRWREGADWGLIILRDPNSHPAWLTGENSRSRSLSNGVYVYVYYYK